MTACLTTPALRSATRRSAIWRAVLAVIAIAGLSACRVDATVDVSIDASGAGTVIVDVVADAEVVSKAPGLANDLRLADLSSAGWIVEGPTALPEGGLRVTLRRPFATPEEATAVLGQLSGPAGPLHGMTVTQRRAFARVDSALGGSIRLDNGLGSFVDADVLAALGEQPYAAALAERSLTPADTVGIVVRFRAPGRLQLTDGSPLTDDRPAVTAVEWTSDFAGVAAQPAGQPMNAEIRLSDDGARAARRWRDFAPWAAAAWVALIVLIVTPLVSLIARRHRRQG